MALLLIWIALFSAVICNELDDEAGVVVFNPESYKQARTYGEAWLVMFVAPDCPYSREWEEKWRFMANRWGPKSQKPRFNLAKFDCYAPGNFQVCRDEGID